MMENGALGLSVDLNLLQDLVINNPDLDRLEALLNRFNIFEALNIVRQEIRHSEFLAFLLDPRQNHGLDDFFLKRLLQESINHMENPFPITPIHLDIWDLDNVEIRREWQSIDILILDDEHKFAVIIENKLFTGEHSNQLERYREVVREHFPDFTLIPLFLTPEGEPASEPSYISISYSLICGILENIIQSRETTLGRDILLLLKNYTEMLRRYIVGESEIEVLCKQIYRKHKRALDLIYEYRPDQQAELQEFICDLIDHTPQFEIDQASKSNVFFYPKHWDELIPERGLGWTRSGRILLFQFVNSQQSLRLALVLGPGPNEVREKIFTIISRNEPPFKRSFKTLGLKWSQVYGRNFLSETKYQEKTTEELKADIQTRWKEFVENEFPKLNEVILNELAKLNPPHE